MKRFSITLLAVALVALLSSAVMAEGMTFGVKGGINLANVTGDTPDGNEMKLGGVGGIYFNYAITEAFCVQPEVLFVMAGTKVPADPDDVKWNFNYIDIPVLAKYAIPMEGSFKPAIFAGPYIGMLMSAKAKQGDNEMDVKDSMKTMEFGLMVGAGFDYMISETGCITFDARYALGLSNIWDVEGDDSSTKTSGIMFMVGYGFMF